MIKWTPIGQEEPPKKSKRKVIIVKDDFNTRDLETNAYLSSLHHDENTWELLNKTHQYIKDNNEIK